MRHTELIHESIMRDMSEGVMTIGFDGVIRYINDAAAEILSINSDCLLGKKFASCFFEYAQNDPFNQTILDAVYDRSATHKNIVPFFTGQRTRQLQVTTSYLHDQGKRIGVIVVLNDISELTELRDAVKAMQKIQALNGQLEIRNQLLSETFGRFLSDEIVRQLLDTPDGLALGGKKQTLTVMMSDLRGFTAISERMEPQDLISMLNHYLGLMTEVIQHYNGTIIEFIGDGILAIFGAPLPSDTHAADAVAAAIAMQNQMNAINSWNAQRGYPILEMGIGINTGEMIVGNIGSEKRTKYGVVGSHVNLCGRIESYTVGGQILISPITRSMISGSLEISQEMDVFPKGVNGSLKLCQPVGIGSPYHLKCEDVSLWENMTSLHVPVRFRCIWQKHKSEAVFEGVLLAASEKNAILRTAQPLKQFDNLSIELQGEAFAKVLAVCEQTYSIRFTALPENFSEWLRNNTPE